MGHVSINPTADLALPTAGRRERAATPAQAVELLAALAEFERALWATAFYAGLRRGELRGAARAGRRLRARGRSASSAAGTTRKARSSRSRGPGRGPCSCSTRCGRCSSRSPTAQGPRRLCLRTDCDDGVRAEERRPQGERSVEGRDDQRTTGRAPAARAVYAARGTPLVLDLPRPCGRLRDARRPVHGSLERVRRGPLPASAPGPDGRGREESRRIPRRGDRRKGRPDEPPRFGYGGSSRIAPRRGLARRAAQLILDSGARFAETQDLIERIDRLERILA